MTDLAATVLWPMVAIVLVLCGATFATSGRPAAARPGQQIDRARGGRRATDHLPGDRVMVVVAGGDGVATVEQAMAAARRSGASVIVGSDLASVGDLGRPVPTYDRSGTVGRSSQVVAVNSRA